MIETLMLPPEYDGQVWQHVFHRHSRTSHSHAELELNLVIRGRATYLLGERRFDLRPGTLIWLFPAQEHILLRETLDYAMWIGVFTPTLVKRICTTSSSAVLGNPYPPSAFCKTLRPEDAARLEALLTDVASALDAAHRNAGLGYLLLSAWEVFSRAGEGAPGKSVHPAVEAAARRIQSDPEAAKLEQIAADAGLSASHLGRLFRAQLGVSVPDFRNAQRVERFLRIYGEKETAGRRVSLLEAALEAGWGSYAQFHRVWTKRIGGRPSDLRRGLAPSDET